MSLDPSINSSSFNTPSNIILNPVTQIPATENCMISRATHVAEAANRSLTELQSSPKDTATMPSNPHKAS